MPSASQPDIKPANAHLFGFWFLLLFTGAYYVYFPQCVVVLRRKIRDGMSIWLPLMCGVFFVLTTTALLVEMIRAYDAWGANGPNNLADPVTFFRHGASPLSLAKNSINVITAILSDTVIVYRTYIVWNCNLWIIIIPTLTLFAQTGMGIWSVLTLSQTKTGDALILADVTIRVRYFFVLTFCLNLLCASLICWRIWRLGFKRSRGLADSSPLSHVMGIIIESAGLYCAYLCVMIITNIIGSNVFFIFLDPTPPVVAIVYSMLIVRAQAPRENLSTSTPLPSSMRYGTSINRASAMTGLRPPASPIGVEINLERVVHTDGFSSPRSPRFDHPYAAAYVTDDKDKAGVAF